MRDFLMRNQKIIQNNCKSFDLLERYFSNTLSVGFLLRQRPHQNQGGQDKVLSDLKNTLSKEFQEAKARMEACVSIIDGGELERGLGIIVQPKEKGMHAEFFNQMLKSSRQTAANVREISEQLVASINSLNKHIAKYEILMRRYAEMGSNADQYKQVDEMLQSNDQILDTIDQFVDTLESSEPNFYKKYKKIRQFFKSGTLAHDEH